MNCLWLRNSILAIIPLVLVFSIQNYMGIFVGDYWVHLAGHMEGYPPFIDYCLTFLAPFFGKPIAMYLMEIAFIVVIPYCLIYHITKKPMAAWIYLYGSSIPIILGFVWFLPQAVIQILMLLSLINPLCFIPFVLLGWMVHNYWWAGVALTLAYKFFRWEVEKDAGKSV